MEGTPKKSRNDEMTLLVFHRNETLTFDDFQKRACRPLYRAVRRRYKTFFGAPSVPSEDLSET